MIAAAHIAQLTGHPRSATFCGIASVLPVVAQQKSNNCMRHMKSKLRGGCREFVNIVKNFLKGDGQRPRRNSIELPLKFHRYSISFLKIESEKPGN